MPRKNKIILRTGSGTPSASDFVAGEPAWDSANGKLFLRNAAGSMVEVGAGGSGSTELVYTAATTSALPATGDATKLYVTTDTGRVYRWVDSTTKYVELGPVGGGDTTFWNLFLPGAPTSVSGTAGNAQVTLSWTAPSGVASQTPLTDYVVQYATSPFSSWITFADGTSTATSATVTGLTNGTAYQFRVAAVNAIGTGSYSSASSSVTPGVDAFFSSVALLLHMEGSGATFTDSSGTPKTVTAAGGITQSTAQSKFGTKSALFSTAGDYLSLADQDALELGSSDFAIEFFMLTTNSTQYATLVSRSPGAYASGMWSLLMNSASGTSGDIALYAADIGSPILQSSGVNLRDGAWHHVAMSRSGSNWSLYVDGTRVGTGTSSATVANISGGLRIGADEFYGRNYTGNIDEFRFTRGSARGYTGATITVPTAALPDA